MQAKRINLGRPRSPETQFASFAYADGARAGGAWDLVGCHESLDEAVAAAHKASLAYGMERNWHVIDVRNKTIFHPGESLPDGHPAQCLEFDVRGDIQLVMMKIEWRSPFE